jgi:hypothetical protein
MKREADGIFYGHNTFELDAGRLCPPKVESVKVHINEDIDLPDLYSSNSTLCGAA